MNSFKGADQEPLQIALRAKIWKPISRGFILGKIFRFFFKKPHLFISQSKNANVQYDSYFGNITGIPILTSFDFDFLSFFSFFFFGLLIFSNLSRIRHVFVKLKRNLHISALMLLIGNNFWCFVKHLLW